MFKKNRYILAVKQFLALEDQFQILYDEFGWNIQLHRLQDWHTHTEYNRWKIVYRETKALI